MYRNSFNVWNLINISPITPLNLECISDIYSCKLFAEIFFMGSKCPRTFEILAKICVFTNIFDIE